MPQNDWWMRGQPPVAGQVSAEDLAAESVGISELAAAVKSVVNDIINTLQGSYLLSAPTLAIGVSDPTTVAFAELLWSVNGVRYRIAAGEVAFTATTHDVADPDTDPREAVYLLSIGAGGTAPTITKGTTAAAGLGAAPATPAGHVVIGNVRVQHDGTAIFDATTNELDAEHLTVTYTSATPHTIATI